MTTVVPRFDPVELETEGFFPTVGEYYGFGKDSMPRVPRFRSPVTPRENFALFRAREPFYWVPCVSRDFNLICPDIVPDFPACGLCGGRDSFGVEWLPTQPEEGMPAFVDPGRPAISSIERWREELVVPDVDSWDWENSGKLYREGLDPARPNLGILISGFFERLISLLGFEEAAMALLTDEEAVCAMMAAFADYNIAVMEHYKAYYGVDGILIHDDWGAQKAPFFSKDTLRSCILPAFQRFVDRAHQLGLYVIHHSCGCIESLVEEMIACGSDAWQVQRDANPQILQTVKEFGGRIQFDLGEVSAAEDGLAAFRACAGMGNVFLGLAGEDSGELGYEMARRCAVEQFG